MTLFPEFCWDLRLGQLIRWSSGWNWTIPAKILPISVAFPYWELDPMEGEEGEKVKEPIKRYVDKSVERTWHAQPTFAGKIDIQISLESFWKEEGVGLEVKVWFGWERQRRARCAGKGGTWGRRRERVPGSGEQKFPCLPFLACSTFLFPSQNNSALWLSYQDVPSRFCLQCFPS